MSNDYTYKVGGSLSEEAPSYVVRQADDKLYQNLKLGGFCYVLNSRQMGKTSLLVRTMRKLEASGVYCTTIDVSGRGSQNIQPEQWYASIVYTLVANFQLANASEFMRGWWQERLSISPVQRFGEFIEEVLLNKISGDIVVFIDEIDSILSLQFESDDFFALIRSCYEKRSLNSNYKRLTFALIGVATPSDLISDKTRTPFNIGCAIQLYGFKVDEAVPLLKGLHCVENPLTVLQEVLAWTNGQPFLTQKLCNSIYNQHQKFISVENIVKTQIITNWESQDEPPHLKTIRDRISARETRAGSLLGLYQSILRNGAVPIDDSPEQIELRLSGLVVEESGYLKVYNKIYASIFNLHWVEKMLNNLRPYSEVFTAWVASNYQDESRLLQGKALQDALLWANGKNLSNDDYRFLSASQELEKQEFENALAVKEEESRILAQANDTLYKAQNKARKQIRVGASVLTISLIGTVIASFMSFKATQHAQYVQEVSTLEQTGVATLRQFENKQIEPLISAMETGQKLRQLVRSQNLSDYPTTTPILALQTIVDKITERTQLTGHKNNITDANWSKDGKYIATTSLNNISIWDTSGKLQTEINNYQGGLVNIRWNPNGKFILSANLKVAQIWDLSNKSSLNVKTQNMLPQVDWSLDSNFIYLSTSGKNIYISDNTGKRLTTLIGHTELVNSVRFIANGRMIASTSLDKTTRIWDISGKSIAILQKFNTLSLIQISADRKYIVGFPEDNSSIFYIWDANGKLLSKIPKENFYVSLNGNYIIKNPFNGGDNIARILNFKGQQIAKLKGHTQPIFNVSISPDGQNFVTTSFDNTARIWDLTGKQLAKLEGHQDHVTGAEFSPNGKLIVTASADTTARVWNISGKFLFELPNRDYVSSAQFTKDGKHIITSAGNKVRVWDLSGRQIAEYEHETSLAGVEPSPDGKKIMTITLLNNRVRTWRLDNLDTLLTRGCDWLQDYLATHPTARERLKVCNTKI
ncbi:hypothetical protein NIES2101_11830 [Calothrix sp. HK-06]|nr:hypothetical protein NIES2101_11830 [Calothrix sp. HK-06]